MKLGEFLVFLRAFIPKKKAIQTATRKATQKAIWKVTRKAA